MQIGTAPHAYAWLDHWARVPDNASARNSGRTHGIAVTPDGTTVVFAQCVPAVLFFDAAGKLVNSWGDRFSGAHGLRLVHDKGVPHLWLVDHYSCEVSKTTLDGKLVIKLPDPPLSACPGGKYVPTWADQDPATGNVWVADGYGGSVIHIYQLDGTYVKTLNGEEGAGRFSCPHSVGFGPDGHAYITDRANCRVTVYDSAGKHVTHRDGVTHSPCDTSFHGGLILVPELFSGVKLLDMNLNLVAELGANPAVREPGVTGWVWPKIAEKGWPNLAGTEHVQPGKFNSPHGAAFAPNGDIIVGEWIVGGRVTRLVKA